MSLVSSTAWVPFYCLQPESAVTAAPSGHVKCRFSVTLKHSINTAMFDFIFYFLLTSFMFSLDDCLHCMKEAVVSVSNKAVICVIDFLLMDEGVQDVLGYMYLMFHQWELTFNHYTIMVLMVPPF